MHRLKPVQAFFRDRNHLFQVVNIIYATGIMGIMVIAICKLEIDAEASVLGRPIWLVGLEGMLELRRSAEHNL